jgi:hypothetical protein
MNRSIRNIGALEKEMYRLRLRKMKLEMQLDENMEYLQKHYASMTMHSVFNRTNRKEEEKAGGSGHGGIREKLGRALDKVVDHLLDRTADGIERVVEHFFSKKE